MPTNYADKVVVVISYTLYFQYKCASVLEETGRESEDVRSWPFGICSKHQRIYYQLSIEYKKITKVDVSEIQNHSSFKKK
jgi:hypothetical protein